MLFAVTGWVVPSERVKVKDVFVVPSTFALVPATPAPVWLRISVIVGTEEFILPL